MRHAARRSCIVVSSLLAASACAPRVRSALAQTPATSAPTLIVFITVDQMRADYFERFSSQLTGGLGRL
jgi:predicted AlkP superfamily pyrophosphatase or phosphodiesterase